jgi:hypothetical protein
VVYQLSGDWFVDWANPITAICFDPNGQPFFRLVDTTYRVTAVNGQFDISIIDGSSLARGVPVQADGTVKFQYRAGSGTLCLGREPEFVFDITLNFNLNGTGTGSAHWTYGFNTNCFVCDKADTAVLLRIARP